MLKELFTILIQRYTTDTLLVEKLWREIEKQYTGKKRYYHNLLHLEQMYNRLSAVKNDIEDWDTLLFALFYHDIIYKVPGKDNEERSAAIANERLTRAGLLVEKINRCGYHILATKLHQVSEDNDTNYLLDADLSVLGQSGEEYETYTRQIRKEYGIYPDFLYKPGRKKVVQHFLQMERIFKTEYFYSKYERQAKQNLSAELESL